nr:MAG TPA: hypothetical protein [Caudoviricetes sp.]
MVIPTFEQHLLTPLILQKYVQKFKTSAKRE